MFVKIIFLVGDVTFQMLKFLFTYYLILLNNNLLFKNIENNYNLIPYDYINYKIEKF